MKSKAVLILTLILSLCMSILLTSCEENPCAHAFDNSCDPDCSLCGYERTTCHVWKEATCFEPRTCRNCEFTEGEALLHTHDLDCESHSVCENCYMVAAAVEHQPDERGVCTICGESVVVTIEVE